MIQIFKLLPYYEIRGISLKYEILTIYLSTFIKIPHVAILLRGSQDLCIYVSLTGD